MDKVSTIPTLTTRRPKWQYQAMAPTPRILHLPRRPRRKTQTSRTTKQNSQQDKKGKLEVLFDQERQFAKGVLPIVMVSCEEERRERVEERESVVEEEEEKWKFQAEMLRAECNLLRMEREIAVKKMERRKVQMERILRSAIQSLLSGRKKIINGNNARRVLEEQILELAKILDKLQRRSENKNLEAQKCSNFDKQASVLQKRLEKFEGELDDICLKEIQEMAEASLSSRTTSNGDENFVPDCIANMEVLRKKMERLSTDSLLTIMEDEYRSMLSTTNNSATSSASTSKRTEFPGMPSFSIRQQCNSATSSASTSKRNIFPDVPSFSLRQQCQAKQPNETRACSGCCKAIVRRVVEQVRAETEQWSQMQEILRKIRDEMAELQASRDFWEEQALDSDYQIQSLQSAVKTSSSKAKVDKLQEQVSSLHAELAMLRKDKVAAMARTRNSPPEAPKEMEKRVLYCHPKENHNSNGSTCKQKEIFADGRREPPASVSAPNIPKRSPFRDIGNSSLLVYQNSR